MNFWKQIPGATRVYLIILIYLSIMLLVLIFVRVSLTSSEGFSLRNMFLRKGARETVISESSASLTATAVAIPTYAPGIPWLRAIEAAEVHNGPGSQYNVIALLEKDQTAEIIGANPGHRWWMIKLPYVESGRGWVSSNLVVAENAENITALILDEETPTSQTPIEEVPTVRAYMNVNIRSGPDMTFERIGVLRNGETAEVLGKSENGFWWGIKLPGSENLQGWISKDYVIADHTDDVPVLRLSGVVQDRIPPTPVPGAPSLIASYPVNIRAGPGIEYAVVGQLDQGQAAEVVGINLDGLWIAIKLPTQQNERGWVAAAYVKLANASNVPILK